VMGSIYNTLVTMYNYGLIKPAQEEGSTMWCVCKCYPAPVAIVKSDQPQQRKRKSRCVLEEDSPICVLCKFHNQECTFLQNPQSRKRKIPQDSDNAEASKRR
jgi:hypothetical protein